METVKQPEALILVVEDDVGVARFLVRGLREEGYGVDLCEDGLSAVEQAGRIPYDLALLDWSLPGSDGLSVLRRWRADGIAIPVIMLTARKGTDAAILALDNGADDFVEKPFSFDELLARLRANLRRNETDITSTGAATVRIGAATYDRRRRVVARDGERHNLSPREHELLEYMLSRRGEVLTRSRILDRVWGMSHDPTTNVVDVYVRYLRSKLDGDRGLDASVIETVRGRGYRLQEPE